jgi:hypothetical protein
MKATVKVRHRKRKPLVLQVHFPKATPADGTVVRLGRTDLTNYVSELRIETRARDLNVVHLTLVNLCVTGVNDDPA